MDVSPVAAVRRGALIWRMEANGPSGEVNAQQRSALMRNRRGFIETIHTAKAKSRCGKSASLPRIAAGWCLLHMSPCCALLVALPALRGHPLRHAKGAERAENRSILHTCPKSFTLAAGCQTGGQRRLAYCLRPDRKAWGKRAGRAFPKAAPDGNRRAQGSAFRAQSDPARRNQPFIRGGTFALYRPVFQRFVRRAIIRPCEWKSERPAILGKWCIRQDSNL